MLTEQTVAVAPERLGRLVGHVGHVSHVSLTELRAIEAVLRLMLGID